MTEHQRILSEIDPRSGIRKDNVISPYEEMLAYETLWAIEGMTEAKLSQLFKDANSLPSEVLKSQLQPSLFKNDPVEQLRDKVDKYLKTKLGSFSVVVNRDFQYPLGLRDAKHPIELFYYKGNLDLLKTKCISIVGARKASDEGKKRAARLAKELVKESYTIVSGLAAGIDTAAMTSAVESGGNTIGVIGTPIDQYYPKENKDLQDRIAKDFLLISQVPFYRYKQESFQLHRHHFPRRNVTMASISDATIIVEASDTSGSLTQARACISQKKKLFILDSCFKNPQIKWPHTYLEQGAIRVRATSDILSNLK
jgi:DNA processing protein